MADKKPKVTLVATRDIAVSPVNASIVRKGQEFKVPLKQDKEYIAKELACMPKDWPEHEANPESKAYKKRVAERRKIKRAAIKAKNGGNTGGDSGDDKKDS